LKINNIFDFHLFAFRIQSIFTNFVQQVLLVWFAEFCNSRGDKLLSVFDFIFIQLIANNFNLPICLFFSLPLSSQ